MKNIFSSKLFLTIIIIVFSILVIIFSIPKIKIDSSIQSLFPCDENMERSIGLSSLSPIADKVILYIEVAEKDSLEDIIKKTEEIIQKYPIDFKNAIPDIDDIQKLLEYSENYSLLLYSYEYNKSPFTYKEIKKRLNNKAEYLMSLPFFNPQSSFFLDPLMMGQEVLKNANDNSKGKYSPKYGGMLSTNKKAYIKILKSGFYSEDYESINHLKEIDNELKKLSKKMNCKTFLYSSHLYFLESKNTIIRDITIISILTAIFLLSIFYFFFKKITLLFFSFMPIISGFAITLLLIAIFKGKYGGIALAAGITTSGIAIDYTIHYLSKRDLYISIQEIRSKIGFSLILGFITTIASFIFLPFSKIISLQEIAIFGILTISFAFLLSWFVLQKFLPPGMYDIKIKKIAFPIFHKKAFFIWLIFMIIFLIFVPFIKFEKNIFNLDMKHKELKTRLDIIQNHFLESSDNIFLAFTGKNKDDILEKSLSALHIVQKESSGLSFFTPAIFYPPKTRIELRKQFIKKNFNKDCFLKALNDSVFNKDSFNKWLDIINKIDTLEIESLPKFLRHEINSLFVKWHDKYYLLIPLYKREVSEKISLILTKNKIDFYIIDILKDSASGLISFEKNALILLLLSIVIIFIILLVAYKNILYAISSILPCIAALTTCIVLTVFTMRNFNIMHFVAAILLLGIGVDYGIFITSAFKDNLSNNEIQATFQSIFISALTTLAGFGVLTFSSNYSISSLGTGMFTGIVSAFLTAYFALPYILKQRL